MLNTRLKELRDSDLVALEDPEGYALTPLGKELLEQLLPLHGWAERWAKRG